MEKITNTQRIGKSLELATTALESAESRIADMMHQGKYPNEELLNSQSALVQAIEMLEKAALSSLADDVKRIAR